MGVLEPVQSPDELTCKEMNPATSRDDPAHSLSLIKREDERSDEDDQQKSLQGR